jgi:methylthioribulose-1-phosphate dehydratase
VAARADAAGEAMAHSLDALDPRTALIEIARDFHRRGWMAGTAGNLSVRDPHHSASLWITASGLAKGRLDENDFLRIDIAEGRIEERFRDDAKPSAETDIHRAIYQLFPQAKACLHVHSVEACVATASRAMNDGELPLPPLEMLKGLGIWDERPAVAMPLFPNYADVSAIATAIRQRFTVMPPPIPVLMIQDHGATVWGGSLQEAYNRVEIVEFLMSYLAHRP